MNAIALSNALSVQGPAHGSSKLLRRMRLRSTPESGADAKLRIALAVPHLAQS
jgi:hypothetical protein